MKSAAQTPQVLSEGTLPSAYLAASYESAIYERWQASGYCNPDTLPGDRSVPYAIVMPPPNVTGVLHIGHALEQAIMDIKIRFERMRGRRTLLLPGTDHAAVATQARVEKDLIEGGMQNPRKELGREELLRRIREFAETHKSTMLGQMKKLGASADWSRLAYTLDEERSTAVVEVFSRMYKDGLIYRGYRAVNWSVAGQSTASDDELVHVERTTTLYTMKYSADFPIPIATTRPETKLGDTAVAVHPNDARYAAYVGKTFTIDFGAAEPLQIRVVADPMVDPAFGTGAVGVTPAHSMTDFELRERHDLQLVAVIGTDGRMTAAAGRYAGLPVEEARAQVVATLREQGLLLGEEEIAHNVATSDRFGDVVEVIPMTQWFVAVNKEIPGRGKTLKELMREAGGGITIKPERFKGVYEQWIDHLRDWCISRQIWWGHRIPVWYKKDSDGAEEIYVGAQAPAGNGWVQDEDTLDTWFSSGLWTFSTLGWPAATKNGGKTGDLATFHPINWMQMGYEIVFFWMARMILMGTYILDEVPFKEVYIHGLVRDKDGRKFSKSLRNVIDPLEVIEKYGTDALRLALIAGVTPGNDVSFYLEKVEHYQHFVNKLWNISRFILGPTHNADSGSPEVAANATLESAHAPQPSSIADHWILNRLHAVTSGVTEKLAASEFSMAAQLLYAFTWEELADWYIEAAKIEGRQSDDSKARKQELLRYILANILRLWHPFIPYVTEVIWSSFSKDLLMIAPWPTHAATSTSGKGSAKGLFAEADSVFAKLREAVVTIRNYKAEHGVAPAERINVAMPLPYPGSKELIEGLARCTIEERTEGGIVIQETSSLTPAKRAELEAYVTRLEKKLADPQFTDNAPATVVDGERKKLADAKAKLGSN